MRIHTDTLTHDDLTDAARAAGVSLNKSTQHGSRRRARAFEVLLEGSGTRGNSGWYGAADRQAATWDEWGVFLAVLFDRDTLATIPGVYENAEHFHWVTGNRFDALTMPADTHKRHSFRYDGTSATGSYSVSNCTRCTAITRRGRNAAALATILEN